MPVTANRVTVERVCEIFTEELQRTIGWRYSVVSNNERPHFSRPCRTSEVRRTSFCHVEPTVR